MKVTQSKLFRYFTSTMQWCPTIRILGIYITPKLHEKSVKRGNTKIVNLSTDQNFFNYVNSLDNFEVTGADGVV